jgi:uncharacterized repeat protein (TIGR03803 family)
MLHSHAGCLALARRVTETSLALMTAFLLIASTSQPAHAQTFSVIHNFTGNDGVSPYAGPTLDAHGRLYGTTYSGGTHGSGSVYKLTQQGSSWLLNPLYSFTGEADGAGPAFGSLAIGSNGTLFGVTEGGGIFGVLFNLVPRPNPCISVLCSWTDNVIHVFGNGQDGSQPMGGPVFDSAGNLYGTANLGGAHGNGAVYEATHSGQRWNETILYSFGSGTDAANPVAGVTMDALGNLYGTTPLGGANGDGAVYKLTHSGSGWTESVIYNFTGGNDGQNPVGGVIVDASGNLYGGTFLGGTNGGGTVYKLAPSGGGYALTTIYSFSGFGGPYNKLAFDASGTLYGATESDGAYNAGTVFKLAPNGGSWTMTDLHDFTGGSDGGTPYGGVALDSLGDIFGTTSIGGSHNDGVVWQVTP